MDIRPGGGGRAPRNPSTQVHITANLQKTLHLQEKKRRSGTVPRVQRRIPFVSVGERGNRCGLLFGRWGESPLLAV
jgi:hypothetical protein